MAHDINKINNVILYIMYNMVSTSAGGTASVLIRVNGMIQK